MGYSLNTNMTGSLLQMLLSLLLELIWQCCPQYFVVRCVYHKSVFPSFWDLRCFCRFKQQDIYVCKSAPSGRIIIDSDWLPQRGGHEYADVSCLLNASLFLTIGETTLGLLKVNSR